MITFNGGFPVSNKLTQKRLKEILHYDPATGMFAWLVNRKQMKVFDIAGYVTKGYQKISIDGKQYLTHRLAFLYIHSYFPEHGIDHIDHDKLNNRIDNLREASQQCNQRNCGNPKDNSSGVKGVSWGKHDNKWYARIAINYKHKYLGYYVDFDDAACARLAGEQACNWSGCDSSSPAFKYVQKNINPLIR